MRDFQLSLISGTVLCTVHLLLGMVIGFLFGQHCRQEAATGANDTDSRRFRESMERLARQVQRLSDLAHKESHLLPKPFSEGITGLVETVRQVQRSARTAMAGSSKNRLGTVSRKKRISHALPHGEPPHAALPIQRLDSDESHGFSGLPSTIYDELTGSDAATESADELLSVRRPYHVTQYMAAWDGTLPRGNQYQEIECNDLSASGMSFFVKELPTSKFLTITLGLEHDLLMLAEVVNHQRWQRGRSLDFLVGCRFTKRLNDVPDDLRPVTFQTIGRESS
jgi:hypothetical protein